jgi:hypothetical protein
MRAGRLSSQILGSARSRDAHRLRLSRKRAQRSIPTPIAALCHAMGEDQAACVVLTLLSSIHIVPWQCRLRTSAPGAECSIVVRYKSGPSRAQGLGWSCARMCRLERRPPFIRPLPCERCRPEAWASDAQLTLLAKARETADRNRMAMAGAYRPSRAQSLAARPTSTACRPAHPPLNRHSQRYRRTSTSRASCWTSIARRSLATSSDLHVLGRPMPHQRSTMASARRAMVFGASRRRCVGGGWQPWIIRMMRELFRATLQARWKTRIRGTCDHGD